jgi:hypothetical protein
MLIGGAGDGELIVGGGGVMEDAPGEGRYRQVAAVSRSYLLHGEGRVSLSAGDPRQERRREHQRGTEETTQAVAKAIKDERKRKKPASAL